MKRMLGKLMGTKEERLQRLLEKQRYFQSVQKPTYLKGPYDHIFSVAIPLALAVSCVCLTAKGIYNMSHGIGKKE